MSFSQTCKSDIFNVERLHFLRCSIVDCKLYKSYSLYTPVRIVNNINKRLEKTNKKRVIRTVIIVFRFPVLNNPSDISTNGKFRCYIKIKIK